MVKAAWPITQPNILVLDTCEAILDLAPLLESLAARCGQAGAMRSLSDLLKSATERRQTPYLVLVLRPEEHPGRSLSAEDLEAASLFFEHRPLGLRTGAMSCANLGCASGVIAPEGQGMRMAALAARALMERGAEIVVANYQDDSDARPKAIFHNVPGILFASRQQTSPQVLGEAQAGAELLVRRKCLYTAVLCWSGRLLPQRSSMAQQGGLLRCALKDRDLQWRSGIQPVAEKRRVLGKAAPSERAAY